MGNSGKGTCKTVGSIIKCRAFEQMKKHERILEVWGSMTGNEFKF
jgi:hypothetical protein